MNITPHIKDCERWLDLPPGEGNTRAVIQSAANEYVDKVLTFRKEVCGKEIKRDISGILGYRNSLKEFSALSDIDKRNIDKVRVKNINYLLKRIFIALSVRAKEDTTGAYQFLNADEVEDWEREYHIKFSLDSSFVVKSYKAKNKHKRGRSTLYDRILKTKLSKGQADKIIFGLYSKGFFTKKYSAESFIYWFCTPSLDDEKPKYNSLYWNGTPSQLAHFAHKLVETIDNEQRTIYSSRIVPTALAKIFPNMAADEGRSQGAKINEAKTWENCDKANIIDSIFDDLV